MTSPVRSAAGDEGLLPQLGRRSVPNQPFPAHLNVQTRTSCPQEDGIGPLNGWTIGRWRGGVVPSPHQGDAIIGKWIPFPGLRIEGTVPPTSVGALKVADPDLGTPGVDPKTPVGQGSEQKTARRLGSPPVVQGGPVRPEPSTDLGQELHPVVAVGPTLDRDRYPLQSPPSGEREVPGPKRFPRGVQHSQFALNPLRTDSGTKIRQQEKAILVSQNVRVHP